MEEYTKCPKCGHTHIVKNGKVKGKQRFKCKNCKFQFTRLTPRGRSPEEKAEAIQLYNLGLSMNAIATRIGVSATTILNWIRKFAHEYYEKPEPSGALIIEIDEMCHYLKKRKINFGYGKHIVERQMN